MQASGIVVIDKPAGITSAKVVAVVKKLLGAKKAGHAGTLDPFATGVMVCCINQATRLARFFLSGHKVYEAVLRLGLDTDTQDGTGTVTARYEAFEFSEKKFRATIKQFTGLIQQKPPVFSALKHKGVPLYKLARGGRPFQKPARNVRIEFIEVQAIALPEIRLRVSCSAGTYIRTLCADIGAAMGCGGHLKSLRRLESSGFSICEAITLQALEAAAAAGKVQDHLIDMAAALRSMPALTADEVLMDKIRFGKPLTDIDMDKGRKDFSDGFVKVLTSHHGLMAVVSLHPKDRTVKYHCVFPF